MRLTGGRMLNCRARSSSMRAAIGAIAAFAQARPVELDLVVDRLALHRLVGRGRHRWRVHWG
eukprot:8441748-Lingulodinium_polyedra.AAC.1